MAPKNTKWQILEFKTLIDTMKDDRSIRCKSLCKVDLKGLCLNEFIKNSTKI